MTKFGAVVVLYKPTSEQIKNIIRLSKLCSYIVAVDNSPALINHAVNFSGFENIIYVSNNNVGGIAGAFNTGLYVLREHGLKIFFLFDQDSCPDDSYFMKMNKSRIECNLDEVLIGPNVFDVNLGRFSPRLIFHKWRYKALQVTSGDTGLLSCSSIISSGTLITESAFAKIGLFREDYFIDHVDTDYCLRAGFLGVPIFINADVILPHSIGERSLHKFLFLNFRPNNHNSIRRYYISRNGVHLSLKYGLRKPSFFLINSLRMFHEFFGIVLFEKDKKRKILALLLGFIDGVFSRLGELSKLHPIAFNYFVK